MHAPHSPLPPHTVVLERLKREGGAIAYALRRQGPADMVLSAAAADKPGEEEGEGVNSEPIP